MLLVFVMAITAVVIKHESFDEVVVKFLDENALEFKPYVGDYMYLYEASPNKDEVSTNVNSVIVVTSYDDSFKYAFELPGKYSKMYKDVNSYNIKLYGEGLSPYCFSSMNLEEVDCIGITGSDDAYIGLGNGIEIINNGIYKKLNPEPSFNYNDHGYYIMGVMQNTEYNSYQ